MTEYLTTKELAELLHIKERKIYALVASNSVPYSKATGKLLFSRDAITTWVNEGSIGHVNTSIEPLPNVFFGSHDPLLDWALRESQCGIATYFDGSFDGIERFVKREGIATGMHIYEPVSNVWNTHYVERCCKDLPVVLVHWAKRTRGLILREGLNHSVKSITDVKGLRFVPRQQKAGAQALFLHLIAHAKIALDDIESIGAERTEVDAAGCIREGKADFTFGLASVAAQYHLPFVPLVEERFDLLVDRRAWFEPGMQKFQAFCHGEIFRRRANELEGYDISEIGTVKFNGH